MTRFQSIASVTAKRAQKHDELVSQRTSSMQRKTAARLERLREDAEHIEAEGAQLTAQLEKVNDKLRYYQKRFQQISSATGLSTPDAIINKFFLKEEIKTQLLAEIAGKEAAHSQLRSSQVRVRYVQKRW